MIYIDYPGKHKVDRFVAQLGLTDLFDENAIAYLPNETYFVSSDLPIIESGLSYVMQVNGQNFTEYVIELDGQNNYIAMFPIQGNNVWKLGINTINFYINNQLIDTKNIELKNIYSIISWNIGNTDTILTEIQNLLELTSLQTMPESIVFERFKELLPKYEYIPKSYYTTLVAHLFTGSVNAGNVFGLTTTLDGLSPLNDMSVIMLRASGTQFWDNIIHESEELLYRRIDFNKPIVVYQELTIQITRTPFQLVDPISHMGLKIRYESINWNRPIEVSFGTETYKKDIDYIFQKNVYGFVDIKWLNTTPKPPDGSAYTITFTYIYTKDFEYSIHENLNGSASISWTTNYLRPNPGSVYGISLFYRSYDIIVNSVNSTYKWFILQNRRLHESEDKTSNGYQYNLIASGSFPIFEEQKKVHFLIKPNKTRIDTLFRDINESYDYITQDGKLIEYNHLKTVVKVFDNTMVYTSPTDYIITSLGPYAIIDWSGGSSRPQNGSQYKIEYSLNYSTNQRRQWISLLKNETRNCGILVKWFDSVFPKIDTVIITSIPYKYTLSMRPMVKNYQKNNLTYPIVYYYGSVGNRIFVTNYTINDQQIITITDQNVINKKVFIEYYFIPLQLIRYMETKASQASIDIINMFYDKNKILFNLLGV